MSSLYERTINTLLRESKVDSFARTVVRSVVNTVVSRIDKINDRKHCIFVLKNLDLNDEDFILRLEITIKKKPGNRVNTSGGWTPAGSMLSLNVYVDSLDWRFNMNMLSALQKSAYDTVRHELEHSHQDIDAYDDKSEESDTEDDVSPETFWRNIPRVKEYFLSSTEMPAFVSGLYHQAKRTRTPFIQAMDAKLDAYKKVAMHFNKEDPRLDALFKKIRREWLTYAKARFQKAIVKKKRLKSSGETQ